MPNYKPSQILLVKKLHTTRFHCTLHCSVNWNRASDWKRRRKNQHREQEVHKDWGCPRVATYIWRYMAYSMCIHIHTYTHICMYVPYYVACLVARITNTGAMKHTNEAKRNEGKYWKSQNCITSKLYRLLDMGPGSRFLASGFRFVGGVRAILPGETTLAFGVGGW